MKPRKSFFAAIAEVLLTQHHQRLLQFGAFPVIVFVVVRSLFDHALIFQQHAGNFAALETLAGGFRLLLVESGKARAVERFLAFHGAFGERIGLAERLRAIDDL